MIGRKQSAGGVCRDIPPRTDMTFFGKGPAFPLPAPAIIFQLKNQFPDEAVIELRHIDVLYAYPCLAKGRLFGLGNRQLGVMGLALPPLPPLGVAIADAEDAHGFFRAIPRTFRGRSEEH